MAARRSALTRAGAARAGQRCSVHCRWHRGTPREPRFDGFCPQSSAPCRSASVHGETTLASNRRSLPPGPPPGSTMSVTWAAVRARPHQENQKKGHGVAGASVVFLMDAERKVEQAKKTNERTPGRPISRIQIHCTIATTTQVNCEGSYPTPRSRVAPVNTASAKTRVKISQTTSGVKSAVQPLVTASMAAPMHDSAPPLAPEVQLEGLSDYEIQRQWRIARARAHIVSHAFRLELIAHTCRPVQKTSWCSSPSTWSSRTDPLSPNDSGTRRSGSAMSTAAYGRGSSAERLNKSVQPPTGVQSSGQRRASAR